MFNARFFAPRFFAPRYWPKVGRTPPVGRQGKAVKHRGGAKIPARRTTRLFRL